LRSDEYPAQHLFLDRREVLIYRPQRMSQNPHSGSGGRLWLFVAGFAAAALLTLGAAVGTSVWQQQNGGQEFAADAAVAQR
jgi:hypothetical protein